MEFLNAISINIFHLFYIYQIELDIFFYKDREKIYSKGLKLSITLNKIRSLAFALNLISQNTFFQSSTICQDCTKHLITYFFSFTSASNEDWNAVSQMKVQPLQSRFTPSPVELCLPQLLQWIIVWGMEKGRENLSQSHPLSEIRKETLSCQDGLDFISEWKSQRSLQLFLSQCLERIRDETSRNTNWNVCERKP